MNNFTALGISDQLSPENLIHGFFKTIEDLDGIYIFNISGVDINKAITGFEDYDEADGNFMITEWELSKMLKNKDYLKRAIFHNGKTELPQTENGLQLIWK